MRKTLILSTLLTLVLTGCTGATPNESPNESPDTPNTETPNTDTPPEMGFFITSVGSGQGGDLGGLEGADAHCQKLAEAVGSKKTWRAYLSTTAEHAKDRIGSGPWYNAKGVMIAKDVDLLHKADTNMINKTNGLNEKGEQVNGRGDTPNRHDILTGSTPEGLNSGDQNCQNWTSSDEGSAMVGHHDRMGLSDDDASKSWNASHASRGCSQEALVGTGGDGLFYCFATD